MRLYLFPESFPYGRSEPFLENELSFLSAAFDEVVIVPLYKQEGIRQFPQNVTVWEPLFSFNPKNKKKLLRWGIFNLSPFGFAIKEFFTKKVYQSKVQTWNFFTSLLVYRTLLANKKIRRKFRQEIKSEDKVYFYWADKSALIIPALKKGANVPNSFFSRFHRFDLYEEFREGYIPFRAYLFPAIDWFVPISEDGRHYLVNHYPAINPDRVKVSRLGVFDNGLNPQKDENDVFHLVSCSNLIAVKRVHLIAEALKEIDFPLKWTHIGSGILQKEIIELANTLPANIEVNLRGALPYKEVIAYYQQNHIDLFINVSLSEGVPVSIMEALSFGIPVLATDVGGTSEVVDDEVGQLLNMNISASEIAVAIQTLATKNLSKMREKARQRWSERSDAEKNYKEFVEFLVKS